MASDIVLREQWKKDQKKIIPKSLLQRHELSRWEKAWVKWDLTAFLSLIGLDISAVVTVLGKDTSTVDALAGGGTGLFTLLVLMMVIGWTEDDVLTGKNWEERKQIVKKHKQMLAAPHANERLERAEDVEYARYSVSVEREQNYPVIRIDKHTPRSGGKLFATEANHAKFQADADGRWGYSEGNRLRLKTTNLEDVRDAVAAVEETAAELERQAYKEAAEKMKLDRLCLLVNAPKEFGPAAAKHLIDEEREEDAKLLLTMGD